MSTGLVYSSTMVNVVGVSTSTEDSVDTTFDFETPHQTMLAKALVTMTSIKLSTLHLLPISLVSSA